MRACHRRIGRVLHQGGESSALAWEIPWGSTLWWREAAEGTPVWGRTPCFSPPCLAWNGCGGGCCAEGGEDAAHRAKGGRAPRASLDVGESVAPGIGMRERAAEWASVAGVDKDERGGARITAAAMPSPSESFHGRSVRTKRTPDRGNYRYNNYTTSSRVRKKKVVCVP